MPDVKDRKFGRMLKELIRRRHNCPREATFIKKGGAYEKLSLVRGGASWLLGAVHLSCLLKR